MLQRDGDPALSDRQRKMVDEAEKSCARMVTIIGELSEISRLDGGTAPFKDQPVDLFQLIREVAGSVHESAERGVKLAVRGESSGAQLTADPMRIRAAFETFFRTILREQPDGTTVAADCRRAADGSAVVVVARDTDVQRSYDAPAAPFNEKRGGLGLIVPIACRIVARYGGRVWSPALAGQTDQADQSGSDRAGRSALIVSFPAEQLS
jgi:signal transduction histidine kinase